jgi:hypothetical protein
MLREPLNHQIVTADSMVQLFNPKIEMKRERARLGRMEKSELIRSKSETNSWTRGASSHARGGRDPQFRFSGLMPPV